MESAGTTRTANSTSWAKRTPRWARSSVTSQRQQRTSLSAVPHTAVLSDGPSVPPEPTRSYLCPGSTLEQRPVPDVERETLRGIDWFEAERSEPVEEEIRGRLNSWGQLLT
jgi:hypothetical protein